MSGLAGDFDISVRGRFISFEGIDGAGKTVQVRALKRSLERRGARIMVTKGDPTIRRLRDDLLEQNVRDPLLQDLLSATSRQLAFCRKVDSALASGRLAIMDRYVDTAVAYGVADGTSLEWLLSLYSRFVRPHLTILLDLDPQAALERRGNTRPFKRIELGLFPISTDPREAFLSYQARVREVYLQLARRAADRFVVIPADGTISDVREKVYRAVAGGVPRVFA